MKQLNKQQIPGGKRCYWIDESEGIPGWPTDCPFWKTRESADVRKVDTESCVYFGYTWSSRSKTPPPRCPSCRAAFPHGADIEAKAKGGKVKR